MVVLSKVQKIVLLSGIVLIVIMSLFPPWKEVDLLPGSHGGAGGMFAGYSFLTDSPSSGNHTLGTEVDVNRLMVQYLAVVIVTVGGFFLTAGMGREDDGSHDVSSE